MSGAAGRAVPVRRVAVSVTVTGTSAVADRWSMGRRWQLLRLLHACSVPEPVAEAVAVACRMAVAVSQHVAAGVSGAQH